MHLPETVLSKHAAKELHALQFVMKFIPDANMCISFRTWHKLLTWQTDQGKAAGCQEQSTQSFVTPPQNCQTCQTHTVKELVRLPFAVSLRFA
jgi:hypothetical protein